MALDTLDIAVLAAIVLALVAYFTKGTLWATEDSGSSFTNSSNSRDLIEVLNENNKKALVVFGSQTGTAEDYAHKFTKEFQSRFSIPTMCIDLADYDYDNLNEVFEQVEGFQLIIFFMATYGEGEPTDNAVEFFDCLDNDIEDLSTVKFSCFGLGNSTYEFYNAMGKRLTSTFTDKNATLIGEMGLGDDGRGSMDEDYLAWKDSLFDLLKDSLNLEEKEMNYEPLLKVTELDFTADDAKVALGEPNSKYVNPSSDDDIELLKTGPFDHTHPYLAPVVESKELFNSKTRNCVHAEFDLSGTNLKYSTGDHLAVWPSNSDEKVEVFLKALNLESKKDTVISLKSLDSTFHIPIPSPTTYESVLRHYLEISGPVSRQFLKAVVQFSPDETTHKKVLTLGDDKKLFHNEITAQYLNVADALLQLSNGKPWTTIPFEFIIESIPHIQPRYYSISSSSLSEKQIVHITAVVENQTYPNVAQPVTGVATNLLLDIQLHQNKQQVKQSQHYDLSGPRGKFAPYKLPVHVRRSTFKLPSNPNTPIIMIGPGTGVAPFRGFIREKVLQKSNGAEKLGKSLLFFGCRTSDEDFLYKNEWIEYSKKLGDSFEMITAFSRETSKKVYVQHKMLEYAAKINELLNQGAFVYVCGDASRMARDVNSSLVKILIDQRGLTEEIATDFVKKLKISNRYQEDVW